MSQKEKLVPQRVRRLLELKAVEKTDDGKDATACYVLDHDDTLMLETTISHTPSTGDPECIFSFKFNAEWIPRDHHEWILQIMAMLVRDLFHQTQARTQYKIRAAYEAFRETLTRGTRSL